MTDHRDDDTTGSMGEHADRNDFSDLEARLALTFQRKSEAIHVADEPFDPSRPKTVMPVELQPIPGDGMRPITGGAKRRGTSMRPARLIWIARASAAAVLVAALFVGRATTRQELLTSNTSGGTTSPISPANIVPGGGPDTGLVPSWSPEDMQVWSVLAARYSPEVSSPSLPRTTQLLRSTTNDSAILVMIGAQAPNSASAPNSPPAANAPAGQGESPTPSIPSSPTGSTPQTSSTEGSPLQIRGTIGSVQPPTQSKSPPGNVILWTEQGHEFTVMLRDLSDEAAVAALNALTLRDPVDPMAGFGPQADLAWKVAGEQLPGPTPASIVVALTYDQSAPTGETDPPVTVMSFGAGDNFPGYLLTAFNGSLRADGLAVSNTSVNVSGTGPAYTMVWPDGRMVIVKMAGPIEEAVAERIALSVQPVSVAGLRELRADVSNRLAPGPVLASADLPSGRLELIGHDKPTAICLREPSGARVCGGPDSISDRRPSPLFVNVNIGATWYVFGASESRLEVSTSGGGTANPAGSSALGDDMPPGTVPRAPSQARLADTASDGRWTFALLAVPEDIQRVSVTFDQGGLGLSRMLI